MVVIYRLVDSGGVGLADADSIGWLKAYVGALPPGRYTVDEIGSNPFPSGHTARRWGVLHKRAASMVASETDPWET
jgi:hypothetical protein